MATEADVVISWFSTGKVAQQAFGRPTVFIQMPTPAGQKYKAQIDALGQQPLNTILKQYAPDIRPMRVACLGFSEGCQGVRALLSSPDGGRIDGAIAIDGIHAQYQQGSKTKIVPAYLTPWGAFGKRAAQGRTLLAITASSIVPPGFASTTETAAWIWRYVTDSDKESATSPIPEALLQPFNPPVTIKGGQDSAGNKWPTVTYTQPPVTTFRRDHGLVITNYADLDPSGHQDHIFQAQRVLPVILSSFLADRWNSISPDSGICTLAGPMDGEEAATANGCFPPAMLSDMYLQGQAEPRYLDIPLDSEVDPTIPGTGPVAEPPAGPPATAPDEATPWSFGKKALVWGAVVSGGAILGELTRRVVFDKKERKR
jgi:hypothetical protein